MANVVVNTKFTGDGAGFEATMRRLSTKLDSWGKGTARTLAGFYSIGALKQFGSQVIQNAKEIDAQSKILKISAEEYQAYQFAAKKAGIQVEDIGKAIKTLGKNMAEASRGNSAEAVRVFLRMGYSLSSLKNMRPGDVFMQISEKAKQAGASVRFDADMTKLLGESATKVLPAMRDGLAATITEAKQLGIVINDDVVAQIANLGLQLDILQSKALAGGSQLVGDVSSKPTAIGQTKSLLSYLFGSMGLAGSWIGDLVTGDKFKFREKEAQRWLNENMESMASDALPAYTPRNRDRAPGRPSGQMTPRQVSAAEDTLKMLANPLWQIVRNTDPRTNTNVRMR